MYDTFFASKDANSLIVVKFLGQNSILFIVHFKMVKVYKLGCSNFP